MSRMTRGIVLEACVCFSVILFCISVSSAQIREEVQEKKAEIKRTLDVMEAQRKAAAPKISSQLGLFFGYDSNALLRPRRKGDLFQETTYSFNLTKPLPQDLSFSFDYFLDVTNYDEVTDISNIFNNLRLSLYRKFALLKTGVFSDLGFFYYPKDERGNFFFPRGSFYVRQDISKTAYHQVIVEYALKAYTKDKALADALGVFQDRERRDSRLSAQYTFASMLGPRTFLALKTRFSLNDSNARYLDFYDYHFYREDVNLAYKLLDRLFIFSNLSYTYKVYKSRTITADSVRQKDSLYAASLGLRHKINENDSVSLSYIYRQNESNDPLAEYVETLMICGLRHNF